MTDHVLLVAFTMSDDDREHAHARLQAYLPTPGDAHPGLTEWWVATDDRIDGSDNDSAVFVHKGSQIEATTHLIQLGLTGRHNTHEPVTVDQVVSAWHRERALYLATLALRTCEEPDATSERDWQVLLDEADAAVHTLNSMKMETT